ncbi:MAG: type II toxin-antitoxin system PemK/MazF family toxin [Micromonosporaceae bacterium]|nr:type II toxin-antitoxin system PemK/MazF family toxin [Micromonosporaceae bacterium]
MRRGEIWTATGGVYATKPRPVVIVQDDRFDATDSVTVCPMTTTPVDAPLLRITVEPDQVNGLEQPSHIMIDKITTTRRSKMHNRLGTLPHDAMVRVEQSLLVFLGIAG